MNSSLSFPRVLFAAAEVFPLAKTGGLGDVSAALPSALARLGVDIRLIMPAYPQALDLLLEPRVVAPVDDLAEGGRLIAGCAPNTGLPVYLYDAPALYHRGGTLYQDADGRDWPDNHLRYASFCHVAARLARGDLKLGWQPDIVHANDWHTGLLPALLAAEKSARPSTVFTIHNLAFQGNFPWHLLDELKLPSALRSSGGLEFFGQLSFLKAGLAYADQLTTVSPTYAKEILTPEFGCGLDGLLRARADQLTGILNGVDYGIWDPAVDPALARCYGADDLSGKSVCKAWVQDELGLARSSGPLMIFVNRLTHQKMADVLAAAVSRILAEGVQVVLHGQGDRDLEAVFVAAGNAHSPTQFSVRIGYDEALARRLTAAADMSLTASRFEPCGLTTMYAMRYGALPVTRHVGGVTDTVVDADSKGSDDRAATGFVFSDETPDEMLACVRRARTWFYKGDWHGIQKAAMRRDFRWERSAQRYLELYRKMLGQLSERDAEVISAETSTLREAS